MSTESYPAITLNDVLPIIVEQGKHIERILAITESQQNHIESLVKTCNFLVDLIKQRSAILKLQQFEIDFMETKL